MGNNPKGSKPGVTGFPQEYNQEPGPRQDLNPDVVDDPSALPAPLARPKRGSSLPSDPSLKSAGRTRATRKGRK